MTEEEQKVIFAKREQELLDKCKIKTREQFIDECGNSRNKRKLVLLHARPVEAGVDRRGYSLLR